MQRITIMFRVTIHSKKGPIRMIRLGPTDRRQVGFTERGQSVRELEGGKSRPVKTVAEAKRRLLITGHIRWWPLTSPHASSRVASMTCLAVNTLTHGLFAKEF